MEEKQIMEEEKFSLLKHPHFVGEFEEVPEQQEATFYENYFL